MSAKESRHTFHNFLPIFVDTPRLITISDNSVTFIQGVEQLNEFEATKSQALLSIKIKTQPEKNGPG